MAICMPQISPQSGSEGKRMFVVALRQEEWKSRTSVGGKAGCDAEKVQPKSANGSGSDRVHLPLSIRVVAGHTIQSQGHGFAHYLHPNEWGVAWKPAQGPCRPARHSVS